MSATAPHKRAAIAADRGAAPNGTALALLRIPHAFTQDALLDTAAFIKLASGQGVRLDLAMLEKLHNQRLLLPLYRVSDTAVEGRRIAVTGTWGVNPRGWVYEAAQEGRLRECAAEGYSVAWPYRRPPDADPRGWWNGFVYSSWQLLDLRDALSMLRMVERGYGPGPAPLAKRRRLTLVLAALATRHLPSIRGTMSAPAAADMESIRRAAFDIDETDLLKIAGFRPQELASEADPLLFNAHSRDPMAKWWPLLRHAGNSGWKKLTGAPLECLWLRIGAEVLLRAHEALASDGILEPLPDLSQSTWWEPMHDRVSAATGDSLERALAEFGLSPHPRVLLLLEGPTELTHLKPLLAELGLDRPDRVRIQLTHGSQVNPHLITRYAVTPRLGKVVHDHHLLEATPTALVVAMDPENLWTPERRDEQRRRLQEAVRAEVRLQGGEITDEDLDFLVRVSVWGDDCYELANFDDDELVLAITELAHEQGNVRASEAAWDNGVRRELAAARRDHTDIKTALGRLRIREDKVRLAELLWPTLLDKFEQEFGTAGTGRTPVVELVEIVYGLVAHLARGTFSLSRDGPSAEASPHS